MKSTLDTIAFFKNIRATLEAMTDEDAGIMIKALFAHDDGEEVDLSSASPMVKALYPLIEESTDRLTRTRMNKVRKTQTYRKDAANEPQNDRKDTAHNHNHSHNQDHSHSQSHNHSSSDEDEKKELKLPIRASLPPMLDTAEVSKAVNDFRAMRKAKKKPMTVRAEELMIKELTKLSGGDPEKAVDILEQSIRNSWTGVYELKTDEKTHFNDMSISGRLQAL